MHIINLVFRTKFIFPSIYVTHNNKTFTNQLTSRHSHLTNILEISPILHDKTFKSKRNQVASNIDIKSMKETADNKLYNDVKNIITNRQIWHKHWQEFLYISSNYPESNHFEDIVSKNYFSQYPQSEKPEDKKKDELLKYDLLDGKIKVSYPRFLNTQSLPSTLIKYTWRKSINRVFFPWLYSLYHSKYQFFLLNRVQKHLLLTLKEQKFPVFIVINGFNQIIINEPEHLINIKQQLGHWLLNSTYNIFTSLREYSIPLREAYIFINPIDAIEYYNYIKSQYPKSARQLELKLFVGNLDEFYKINRLTFPYIQFRLLPDLKEVGKLVTQYQYKNNVNFDYKQIYGKNYFQGQPIYFIEPVTCNYVNNITRTTQPYYFPNSLDLTQEEYNRIFTTYHDAITTWRKYRRKFPQYSLNKNPLLKVYNMESFLAENANQITFNRTTKVKFYFVPSQETYQYIKKLQTNTPKSFSNATNTKNPFLLLVQVWANRILWGMLRRNPPE